jgi:ATP-dependent Lhr-like helicase
VDDQVVDDVCPKRGAHLITAVERLVRLSGEFQRVALSAAETPIERVA